MGVWRLCLVGVWILGGGCGEPRAPGVVAAGGGPSGEEAVPPAEVEPPPEQTTPADLAARREASPGYVLARRGNSRRLRLLDVRTGEQVRDWKLPCRATHTASAPNRSLLVGCGGSTYRLWGDDHPPTLVADGLELRRHAGDHRFTMVDGARRFYTFDLATGQRTPGGSRPKRRPPRALDAVPNAYLEALSADGSRALVVLRNDDYGLPQRVRLVDAKSGEVLAGWEARGTFFLSRILGADEILGPPDEPLIGTREDASAAPPALTCEGTPQCKLEGQCTPRDGRCVAESEAYCRESTLCAEQGKCALKRERCHPGSEGDCAASSGCQRFGHCALDRHGLTCEAASDAHCAASEGCRDFGWCRLGADGRCAK